MEESAARSASSMELTPDEASQRKEEEADRRVAAGDLDGALQSLTKAIFLRPEHATLYAKRAEVYWQLCDVKSAMANFRKLFSVEPEPAQRVKDQFAALLDLHGYSLLTLGESPSVALTYLNEAIQLNALDESYWLHRAVANIEAGCFDKALLDVDHCICLNGRDVEYFVLRAKLHWRLHMQEKATADIQKAAKLQPDHPEVLGHEQRLLKESQAIYEEARTQLMALHFQDAIQSLSKATEITPEETKLYLLRASAYRELGEFHVALRDTEKALTCHRHKLELARAKQQQQHQQQQHQQQQQQLQQLQQPHEPPQPTFVPDLLRHPGRDTSSEYREIVKQRSLILNDIGLRFLRQKSFQLAVNAINQAIRGQMELKELFREQFTGPQLFLNRGDAYRGLGNFQAALADYHHALELLPGSREIQSRVALVHYQFGLELFNRALFDKAELEFGYAIEQDANVATYYVRRGDAARYQEKHHAACADYQQALRLNPNDADTHTKLLQYNVPVLPSTDNQSGAPTTTRTAKPRALSPQQRSAQQMQSNVETAHKSFKKQNKRVQDLFHNRPVVPPSSMNVFK